MTKPHTITCLVLQLKPSYALEVPYSSGSSLTAAASGEAAKLQQAAASAGRAGSNSIHQHQAAAATDGCPCSSSLCQQLQAQGVQLWQLLLAVMFCSSRRWRFFQLSADLTTLRWAWNKYILLYYVDSITADADRLTITLHMVLDPDLTLAFDDPKTYDQWESALQLLLHMLTGAAPGCSFLGVGNSSSKGLAHLAGSSSSSCVAMEPSTYDMSGSTELFGPQAAAAAAGVRQVSQHSLVLTALNVQYGLQQGPLGVGQGSSNAAGQAVRKMSRNSFLRASR
jgi:hypothetical protein